MGVARKALMAATDRNYPIILDTMHEEHQGEMHQNGEYNPNCILYTSDDVTPSKVMAKGMYMAEGNG